MSKSQKQLELEENLIAFTRGFNTLTKNKLKGRAWSNQNLSKAWETERKWRNRKNTNLIRLTGRFTVMFESENGGEFEDDLTLGKTILFRL